MLTWMIQTFGCFYICMLVGLMLYILMELLGTNKVDRATQGASGLASTMQNNFSALED